MMNLNANEIASIVEKQLDSISFKQSIKNQGTIVSIQDGIITIYGLSDVMSGEMIEFEAGGYGLALNLEVDTVGAVVLGSSDHLREGQAVMTTGKILEVPVGIELKGRVVNALGAPIDGKGPIKATATSPVEKIAPGVIDRQSVSQPLQTGITSIDTMTPIGRGQRELIIGDRQTGKTSIAIDTILNQNDKDVTCIYVAIGQKASTVAHIVKSLEEADALKNTIIVAATAAEAASLQYIAPYAGCAMGEFFRDRGEDALIVYDDLSKHAVAYRQISLLLRRPPGREAYPGDIFYLHSRLLERASRVSTDYVKRITNGKIKNKTGSLTALPIIETQAGDVSAFVPTNVISITDGQIFLDEGLFKSGTRPAINSGLSVSRVGGAAQTSIIKKLGGGVRLALAQFRELQAFSQFSSDLDESTRQQLSHGEKVVELLKQPQFEPLPVSLMAITLFVAEKGYLDSVEKSDVVRYQVALHNFVREKHPDLMEMIEKDPTLSDANVKAIEKMLSQLKEEQGW